LAFFLIFHFSFETVQRTETKVGGKDDPYLEGIKANFQRDPLRGFGGKGILFVLLSQWFFSYLLHFWAALWIILTSAYNLQKWW